MTDSDPDGSQMKAIPSRGNVFFDLGFDEPEMELAKAKLALSQPIEERCLTRTESAEITGFDQSC